MADDQPTSPPHPQPHPPNAGKDWRQHLRSCLIMLGLTLVVLVGLGVGARLWADWVWSQHRAEIRESLPRVEPLLTALEMYRKDYDAYPATLTQLTPKYMDVIPEPPFEFKAQWGWEYSADPEMVTGWIDAALANEGFVTPPGIYHLYVTVPSHYSPLRGLFQDRLVYRPDERYPAVAYGGVLERIDGWGYYHE